MMIARLGKLRTGVPFYLNVGRYVAIFMELSRFLDEGGLLNMLTHVSLIGWSISHH